MNVASQAFQRARRPEHKLQRRAAILAAARALALDRGVLHVSLGDIAARAGMAKSNVLRYFETREEVYLQLTLTAYAEWHAAVAAGLASPARVPAGVEDVVAGQRISALRVADVLAETLAERPLLCDLFAHVSSTLEHNVSPVLGREFKMQMVDLTRQLAATIAAAMAAVSEERAFEVVAGTYALVAGLWPMCNPPAELAALLDAPELSHTRVSFENTLRRLLQALLHGLTQMA